VENVPLPQVAHILLVEGNNPKPPSALAGNNPKNRHKHWPEIGRHMYLPIQWSVHNYIRFTDELQAYCRGIFSWLKGTIPNHHRVSAFGLDNI